MKEITARLLQLCIYICIASDYRSRNLCKYIQSPRARWIRILGFSLIPRNWNNSTSWWPCAAGEHRKYRIVTPSTRCIWFPAQVVIQHRDTCACDPSSFRRSGRQKIYTDDVTRSHRYLRCEFVVKLLSPPPSVRRSLRWAAVEIRTCESPLIHAELTDHWDRTTTMTYNCR